MSSFELSMYSLEILPEVSTISLKNKYRKSKSGPTIFSNASGLSITPSSSLSKKVIFISLLL